MEIDRLIADAAGVISIISGTVAVSAFFRHRLRRRGSASHTNTSRRFPALAFAVTMLLIVGVATGGLIIYPRLPSHARGAIAGSPSPTVSPTSLGVTRPTPSSIAKTTVTPVILAIAPTGTTPITPVFALHISPMQAQAPCLDASHIDALPITLNATGSNTVMPYHLTITEHAPNAATAWASANPAAGTIAIGGTARITLTPDAALCATGNLPDAGQTFHVQIMAPQGTTTLAFTILPYRKPL